MQKLLVLTAAALLAAPLAAQAQTPADQIAQATMVLPPDLRAGATVVSYDKATGARTVLRQGTNFIECQPRMDDGFTRCYNKALAPRRDLEAKLRAEKKTDKEVADAVAAAIKAGTLKTPPNGMMSYRGYDKRDRIQNLWVMSVPNGTPESVGVSTGSQRDDALEGKGLPWMMLPGTPGAHIMIPINPPVKMSTVTDAASDPIAQATLPLPEDLRAGAAVYEYDKATGARKVLRPGTNFVECMPKGDDGFTWCYNKSTAARRDLQAKLKGGRQDGQGSVGGGRRRHRGRHDQADAVRDGVLSPLRQEGSHPAAVGDVGPQRHARDDRRVRRQPPRRRAEGRRAAVADAPRHRRRAHHDSDQQVATGRVTSKRRRGRVDG